MSCRVVNTLIEEVFEEVRNQTGLVQGNFTINLFHNGVISGVPVTLTEISGGFYKISFTPNAVGTWCLALKVTAYPRARYGKSYAVDVEQPSSADLTALETLLVAEHDSTQADIAALDSKVDGVESKIDIIDSNVDQALIDIATVNNNVITNTTALGQLPDDLMQADVLSNVSAGNLADYLNRTKKYVANRVLIVGNSYTVKEDNKVDDYETGTITNAERSPD